MRERDNRWRIRCRDFRRQFKGPGDATRHGMPFRTMRRMWKFTKCSAWCRVTVGSDTPRLLFRGSAFLAFTRLPYISLSRYFLFRLLFSRARRLTTRNDIHPVQIKPEYVDLTFPPTQMDEARQDIPSTLRHRFGISFLFSFSEQFSKCHWDTRCNFVQLRYYVTFGKFAKKKKKRIRATGDSEFTDQYFINYSYLIVSL